MKRWEVAITRTMVHVTKLEVEADTEDEAGALALDEIDMIHESLWNERQDFDYDVDDIRLVESDGEGEAEDEGAETKA